MRLSHRKYYQHWEKAPHELVRLYCCPCCDYPTLSAPGDNQICSVCKWEDDDCDAGANGDYTLEEARSNFKKYLTMYRATDEFPPQFQSADCKLLHDVWMRPDQLEFRKRLMALLDEYMAEPDLDRRGEISDQIEHHERKARSF